MGGKVLAVAVVPVDVGHHIRFDGVDDDGVGGVPTEPLGHGGAEDPRPGDDYRLIMGHGASTTAAVGGRIMVVWGIFAS